MMDHFLVSFKTECTLGVIDNLMSNLRNYEQVQIDKLVFNDIFKGFRLGIQISAANINESIVLPKRIVELVESHPFVLKVKKSKIFSLPKSTISKRSLGITNNDNWGLHRIDTPTLPLNMVSN